jgi:hypothetical protein
MLRLIGMRCLDARGAGHAGADDAFRIPGVPSTDLQTFARLETEVAQQIVDLGIPRRAVVSNSVLDNAVRLDGVTAAGWLTAEGVRITVPAWAVKRARSIELAGDIETTVLPAPPAVTARADQVIHVCLAAPSWRIYKIEVGGSSLRRA